MGLSISGLSHAYGQRKALDDVGFEVAQGRFCALLGPNGAGKSTLFSLATRLFATQAGRIVVAGHDLAQHPLRALAAMGVVFQQPTIDLDLKVRSNLLYAAGLHGLGGRGAQQRVDAALDRLGMSERAGERVRDLNGGHRRRMEIARALIHRPRVLLLDEPTVGLDAPSRRAVTDHVHDLAADGISVVWATHLADEVFAEDQVVVLHRGRVLAVGRAQDLCGGASVATMFLGLIGENAG